MSSTTVGTVFNNVYSTTGVPSIPASPTAFVTTGPGAYTGLTGAQNGPQITLPANAMGPNGRVHISAHASNNNSAGTKALIVAFGATTVINISDTTNVSNWVAREISNRGAAGAQITAPAATSGPITTGSTVLFPAIDTTQPVIIGLNFNNNTATDWACLESWLLELIPG
jgi:hypothetical protein